MHVDNEAKTTPLPDPQQPLAGRRVLVADDNPVNRKLAARLLENLSCTAGLACSGTEAVEMHASAPYDLVLMDCVMPQLDGYQATQRIREMAGNARYAPVIALTSADSPVEREKCAAAGMDDFLAKPLRAQALKSMLTRWLPPAVSIESDGHSHGDGLKAVQEMFGADFPELAMLYLADSPPRLAMLRRARDENDTFRLIKIAHAFSGSCASIGAAGLSAMCRELELRVTAGALQDFEQRLAAIEVEYRRVSDKLRAMIKT